MALLLAQENQCVESGVRRLSLHSRTWADDNCAISTQVVLGVEEGREERSVGVFVLLHFTPPPRDGERRHFFPLASTQPCGHTHLPGELGKTV